MMPHIVVSVFHSLSLSKYEIVFMVGLVLKNEKRT